MAERFYCVGCKSHYELPVHEAVKKPSKGKSFRHSIVSKCPKGHKTTRICNAELYDSYNEVKSAESPLTEGPIPDGPPSEPTPVPSATQSFSSRCEVHEAEFEACGCEKDAETGICVCGESCVCDCGCAESGVCNCGESCPCDCGCDNTMEAMEAHGYVDGDGKCACGCVFVDCKCSPECKCGCALWQSESFEATQVVGTMSPGINLEALRPVEGGMENGYEDSMVPADSFQPEGSGHVIGSQSTSHNYTPMHAETFDADELYPYFELRMVTNGTWGDPVDDWDNDAESDAYAAWEDAVNDDGPYILVYWKDTESDGHVVAGKDFLEAEGVMGDLIAPSSNRNRKAAIATAAAAVVIGLIYWKSQKE